MHKLLIATYAHLRLLGLDSMHCDVDSLLNQRDLTPFRKFSRVGKSKTNKTEQAIVSFHANCLFKEMLSTTSKRNLAFYKNPEFYFQFHDLIYANSTRFPVPKSLIEADIQDWFNDFRYYVCEGEREEAVKYLLSGLDLLDGEICHEHNLRHLFCVATTKANQLCSYLVESSLGILYIDLLYKYLLADAGLAGDAGPKWFHQR